ncbi:glycosyltransferase family 4 protein [Mucilaginibacter sp. UYCu711]|uniref:glycosyltransferase family 4 protein n=1 Tax=Mucilaginibacter sp. UYCu711 TaxID=3156339 RepID=UPI003D1C4649
MKTVLAHPTGNRNVRAILQSLIDADLLAEFQTTISINKAERWIKLLPEGIRRESLRRSYNVSPQQLWTHGSLEFARMILPKIGLKRFVTDENSFAHIYSVYKEFDKAASKRLATLAKQISIDAVYAYEDGALSLFEQAKKIDLKCIYDLPIAYWETGRMLMLEEAERLPKWANTLAGGILDSSEKLERKTQEMELADVVVVPGEFVMNSLPQWAQSKKIIMAPFGSPIIDISAAQPKKSVKPLRVLFAGSMGQRKGLGDLFAAVKLLNNKDIELVVMGSLMESMIFYRNEFQNFTYEPGRPHDEVLALMRTCDVFCLPSIVEGRALVMQEAMSQGLPLIITENTGGRDLIIEGETGYLVPIRSPHAIAEKLNWFINNRSKVGEMGEMAKKHAGNYTWEKYGNVVIESIKKYLNNA